MSIYSGFATRNQQQMYFSLLEDLIFVQQKRIMKFYNNEETDEDKFHQVMLSLFGQLHKMDQNKYLQPKFSKNLPQMLVFLEKKKREGRNGHRIYTSQNKNRQKYEKLNPSNGKDYSLPISQQKLAEKFDKSPKWQIGKIKHQISYDSKQIQNSISHNPEEQLIISNNKPKVKKPMNVNQIYLRSRIKKEYHKSYLKQDEFLPQQKKDSNVFYHIKDETRRQKQFKKS